MAAESSSAAAAYTTPTKRTAFSVASEAGPSRARPAGASPAYSSRRHSLYGVEDRIVIEQVYDPLTLSWNCLCQKTTCPPADPPSPGSRIWKVGFSGEPEPRACFWAAEGESSQEMWDLDLRRIEGVGGDRDEGDRLVGVRMVKKLRETFFKHLLTDPKQRKVIIVENTFLPTFVKDHIARTFFDNLKAPSVSFTPSSLLALAACGRITGLVVDIGWLETTVTPVYHSRPLYHFARSTPLAGRAIHTRLRSLLLRHAAYTPPPTSMSTIHDRKPTAVPPEILTDKVIEKIITQSCIVGGVLLPHESTASRATLTPNVNDPIASDADVTADLEDLRYMDHLKDRYSSSSSMKDAVFAVLPPNGTSKDYGMGSLHVPGWIRERAAGILFPENQIGDGEGIPEIILSCLLKLPVDLRQPLISNLLITGGTASLPNLIPRLKISLLSHLLPRSTSSDNLSNPTSAQVTPRDRTYEQQARMKETREWRMRHLEPYKALYGLAGSLAILNDPLPVDGNGGRAPRWVPSLMSWVGGSLAGALKTGAPEITREEYDNLQSSHLELGEAYMDTLKQGPEVEKEMADLVGVSLDELKPGMAVEGLDRKRGWREGVGVGDWSFGLGISAG